MRVLASDPTPHLRTSVKNKLEHSKQKERKAVESTGAEAKERTASSF